MQKAGAEARFDKEAFIQAQPKQIRKVRGKDRREKGRG